MEKEGKRAKEGKVMAALGRYKFILIVLAAGLICLLWPAERAEEPIEREAPAVEIEDDLEETRTEMEEILGKIHGVGQLRLMLTLDRGKEAVLAEESSLSYSGSTLSPEDYSRSSEPVVLNGDEDAVIVRQEVYPRFRGALVVCEGGGDPAVQLAVIEAVSALTGLGADRISVVKWQQ